MLARLFAGGVIGALLYAIVGWFYPPERLQISAPGSGATLSSPIAVSGIGQALQHNQLGLRVRDQSGAEIGTGPPMCRVRLARGTVFGQRGLHPERRQPAGAHRGLRHEPMRRRARPPVIRGGDAYLTERCRPGRRRIGSSVRWCAVAAGSWRSWQRVSGMLMVRARPLPRHAAVGHWAWRHGIPYCGATSRQTRIS
jgi:hypothetical protein